jgi:uncharacterized protein YciI
MEELVYVMILEKNKSYNKINKDAVNRHVEYLRNLDNNGKLALCGASKGWPGVAGMIIIKAESHEEAVDIFKLEPLSADGYTTYQVRTLKVANSDNNFLL